MKVIYRKNQLSISSPIQEKQMLKEGNTHQLGRKNTVINLKRRPDASSVSYLLDEAFKVLVRKFAKSDRE